MSVFAKLTWIELKLFAREPFSVIFAIVFPVVVLLVLMGSFNRMDAGFGGAVPSDYYLASYIGVVIGAVGLIVLPVHLAMYRERGVLRRFRASALPTWSVIGAQIVVGFLIAAIGSVVMIVAGRLLYDAALPEAPGSVVAMFLLGTLSFLAVGFLLATVARTARAAQALGMLLFFPMWLLSGAGPPPDVMSSGMQTASDLMPLTYVVRAVQDPWLGEGIALAQVVVLLVLLVVSAAIGLRLYRTA